MQRRCVQITAEERTADTATGRGGTTHFVFIKRVNRIYIFPLTSSPCFGRRVPTCIDFTSQRIAEVCYVEKGLPPPPHNPNYS